MRFMFGMGYNICLGLHGTGYPHYCNLNSYVFIAPIIVGDICIAEFRTEAGYSLASTVSAIMMEFYIT